jgi:hypothetical protein
MTITFKTYLIILVVLFIGSLLCDTLSSVEKDIHNKKNEKRFKIAGTITGIATGIIFISVLIIGFDLINKELDIETKTYTINECRTCIITYDDTKMISTDSIDFITVDKEDDRLHTIDVVNKNYKYKMLIPVYITFYETDYVAYLTDKEIDAVNNIIF